MSDEQIAQTWNTTIAHPKEDKGLLFYINADHDSPHEMVNLGNDPDENMTVTIRTSERMALINKYPLNMPVCTGCFTGEEVSFCLPMQEGTMGTCGDGPALPIRT